jgi:hypothetical protein
VSQEIFAARWSAMAPAERQVVSVVASASVARPSGEIEGEAARLGIAPAATRQALRRLAARGHIDRLANGQRGTAWAGQAAVGVLSRDARSSGPTDVDEQLDHPLGDAPLAILKRQPGEQPEGGRVADVGRQPQEVDVVGPRP